MERITPCRGDYRKHQKLRMQQYAKHPAPNTPHEPDISSSNHKAHIASVSFLLTMAPSSQEDRTAEESPLEESPVLEGTSAQAGVSSGDLEPRAGSATARFEPSAGRGQGTPKKRRFNFPGAKSSPSQATTPRELKTIQALHGSVEAAKPRPNIFVCKVV